MGLYDFSEEEESSLPLPPQWIRVIDTSGQIVYRNLHHGNVSEEHPFILQALDSARKLKLPTGWVVKETILNNGQKDYFYSNPLHDFAGWDPPQFRSCLAECLMKNGFPEAAKAVINHPNNQLLNHPEAILPFQFFSNSNQQVVQTPKFEFERPDKKMERSHLVELTPVKEDFHELVKNTVPKSNPTSDLDHSTTKKVDWMELMQHLGTLEEPSTQAKYTQPSQNEIFETHYSPSYLEEDDDEDEPPNEVDHTDKYTERTDNESVYSLLSRRSKRSDKWMELLSKQSSAKKISSASHLNGNSHLPPSHSESRTTEITISTLNRLIALEIDANEKCHELLIELRSQLCRKTSITCNLLAYHNLDSDVGSLDTNTLCDHPYRIDQVNSLITIAESLVSLLRNHVELLVMGLASMPTNSPELLLISYTILHRILHPFSSDSSMTTSFLLESLNYQIEATASRFHQENIFYESSKCNGQVLLLITLLTDTLIEDVNFQFQPLWRPVFSYHPISSPNDQEKASWPEFSLTTFGILLRSYGIRRDVTSFFRLVWRQVLPALCAVIENTSSNLSEDIPTASPPRHLLQNITFGKLLPIATRLLECCFLDESLLIYPATATAVIRCFGEICGFNGIYIYLLEFLILPNIIKLLLGDVDSLDNEEPLRYQSLWNHSEKYYDHRNWWPINGHSFIESSNHQIVTILDGSGVLIWYVWRLYSCAVFCTEEHLTTFTVKSFFAPLDLNPSFTALSDTKLRTTLQRLRAKIMKGCQSLLQLPLDQQGAAFLTIQSHEEITALKSHTRNLSNLLKNRINALVMKPQESLNATIISRHETMILFDSIAFICEEQLNESESTIGIEKLQSNETYYEIQRIYNHAVDFLNLCDDLETQQVDLYSEDIMFLWRTPLPRDWSLLDHHGNTSDYAYPVADDISVFTQETFPPPPPDTEPPPLLDLGYCYEQLQRGYSLTLRYISSLNKMLHHLRVHKNTSTPYPITPLSSLLESEEWFYSPEVEISCPLAQDNQLYHHTTVSYSKKLRPSHFGLEISPNEILQPKNEFVPLKAQVHEFFHSFRFQNSSKSAGANTSIDISTKPREIRLVRPPISSNLFSPVEEKTKLLKPKVSYRTKKAPTKITLPDNSPLLVPTESYSQQKYSQGNLSDIDKKFVTSLRTPIVVTKSSSSRNFYPLRHENIHENAQPFPEHLRRHLRDNSHEKNENTRVVRGIDLTLSHDRSTLNVLRRRKERKMPLPVGNDSGNMLFAPTESRLRQLNQEKNKMNEELTIEQEKGWKNLLRSYDDEASEGSSRRLKPFRPSGAATTTTTSEYSQRTTQENQRKIPTTTDTSSLPLANLLLSRGMDVRSFLMKLDQAVESDDRQDSKMLPSEQQEGDILTRQSIIRDPLPVPPIQRSKENEVSSRLPSVEPLDDTKKVPPFHQKRTWRERDQEEEGKEEEVKAINIPRKNNLDHHANIQTSSHPLTFASPSGSTTLQSPAIFQDDNEDDFDFMLDDQKSYGKILSAAKSQDWKGERPLNLQKRLRQKNSFVSKEPDSAEDIPSAERVDPRPLLTPAKIPPSSSSPGSGHSPILTRVHVNLLDAKEPEIDKKFSEEGDGIHRQPSLQESKDSSFLSAEGKSSFLDNSDFCPSPETKIQADNSVLPLTRLNNSFATDSFDRQSSDHSQANEESTRPSSPRRSNEEEEKEEKEEKSPTKPIPILKKQLSITPNEMRNMIIRGYEVIKHGVHGYPKPKVVCYDPSSHEIIWRSSKKDRFSFIRSSSSLSEKSIPLHDVKEVRRGIQTDVLLNGGLLDPGRCLSLVTSSRTLDLLFNSVKERELFVRTIEMLLGTETDVIFR